MNDDTAYSTGSGVTAITIPGTKLDKARMAHLNERIKRAENDLRLAAGFAEYLAALPTATLRDEWISVKDKLPPKNAEVLYTDGRYYFIGIGNDGYFEGEPWHEDTGEITHWMPLVPPAGARNGDNSRS